MGYAHQGGAARSEGADTLSSEGHITCYNVVILDLETRDALMLHVWEGGYGGLSDRQRTHLTAFRKLLGEKVAFVTEGERSTPSICVRRDLESEGIQVLPLLKVPTGGLRWNIAFDPKERRLTVEDEKGGLHYSDVPFPQYKAIPTDEQGLTDEQRLVLQLGKYANQETGALDGPVVDHLRMMLHKTSVPPEYRPLGSSLLYNFVTVRAKAAGYDNYHDYFEASRTHFVDIPLGDPELTLRKIQGVPENVVGRFQAAGIDFDAVSVTPQTVITLLKDYSEVAQLFISQLSSLDAASIEDNSSEVGHQRRARLIQHTDFLVKKFC